jgi:hypothetical protein
VPVDVPHAHYRQKALAISRDVISGCALPLKQLLRRANLQWLA